MAGKKENRGRPKNAVPTRKVNSVLKDDCHSTVLKIAKKEGERSKSSMVRILVEASIARYNKTGSYV